MPMDGREGRRWVGRGGRGRRHFLHLSSALKPELKYYIDG